jgi:PAS domain S-box-containing protein
MSAICRELGSDSIGLSHPQPPGVAMFEQIFFTSPVAITVANRSDGCCIHVNPAAVRLLGYSRDELLARDRAAWETALSPEVRDELLRRFAAQGRVEHFPCTLTNRSGERRDCLISLESLELDGETYALTHIVDVTAHRQAVQAKDEAEQARQASEAQLRAVMDCTPDIIFTVDHQLRIQFINRVPAGQTVADALGTSALDYVLPEHRGTVEQAIRQVFATGQPAAYEIQARGDNGVLRWYATRLTRLELPGAPEQVLLITQDITDRKGAEEAAQQARNLFTRLFHASPVATVLTSLPERRFLDVNAAAEALMGYPRADLLGQTTTVFPLFADQEEHRRVNALIARRGRLVGHEVRLHTRDGAERVCLLSIETLQLEDQQYALTQLVDISTQKQVEQALRDTEHQYRTLVEQSPAVVYVSEGGEHWRYISPQVERLLGYTAEEYRADPQIWKGSVHPDDWAGVRTERERQPRTSRALRLEYRMRTRDGRVIWVHDEAEVGMDPATGGALIHGVMYDITERKEAEAALARATARLQLLADASTAFAEAGMDEPALLETLARGTAEALGAGCVIRLRRDGASWLHAAAVYDPDPAFRETVAALFAATPIAIDSPHPAAQVVRGGQPLLNPVVDRVALRPLMPPALWSALDQLPVHSALIAPLRAHDRTLGCIVLVRHTAGQSAFTQDDLALVQDLAGRAGLALANAWLYREVQAAQQAAQQAHAQLDALIASLPTGVGYFDRKLRYQLVNPALAALNERSPAEHVGQPLAAVVPDLAAEIEPHLQQVLSTGTAVRDLEVQGEPHPSGQGHYTWLVSYFPVSGPGSALNGVGVTLTDITPNKRAEEQLRQSEARFATIFERSPVALGIVRLSDNRFTEVNAAFLSLYGYPREAVVGHTALELSVWATPQERRRFIEQLRVRQRVAGFETVMRTAVGAERQVLLSGEIVQIYDEPHLLVQSIDITALKEAQQTLEELNRTLEERVRRRTARVRESEARFRALVTASSTAIYQMSPDWSTMLQLEGHDFIPTTTGQSSSWLDTYIYPEDQPPVLAAIQAAIRSRTMFELEHRVRRVDGSVGWTFSRAVPLFDERGAITEWFGAASDVTARRLAEEALRESEAQNRLLFEESPAAIALIGQRERIVRANRAFAQLVGHPVERVQGQTGDALGLVSPAQIARLEHEVGPVLVDDTGVAEATVVLTRPDGDIRMVDLRVFTLTIHGERHSLAALHDITRERQSEEALRQANAELARAARAKDEFLATMSHELRTPLNAILGFSESLQDAVYGPVTQAQRGALDAVAAAGQHLLGLINDILDLAKVESGRLELQREPVRVAEVCQASLRFVHEQALKKRLRLHLELNEPEARLLVDGMRLKQMLVNLLSNAVKFTPAGGEVGLAVTFDTQAGVAQFVVSDNGSGIAPEDVGRLFQPFVQLDSALNRAHAGTGLGLALVRRLAEAHGGGVAVESAVGQGSRFTITLPYQPAAQEPRGGAASAGQATPPSAAGAPRARLLLAEDNPMNSGALRDYLEARGYAVAVAHDGHEALGLADAIRPDVILMDIQMPGMDGLEAIGRLRALPAHAATPIIALTALAMPGDKERCLAAGATDYMAKPVRLRALVELIQQLLDISDTPR